MRQVGKAYIIFPRLCTISKYSTLQGQPLRLSVIGEADTKPQLMIIYPLPSRPTIIKLLYSPRFGIFFLFEKRKCLQKKSKRAVPARHPQRRAAVHRSRLSISCSAHSPANAPELELVCNITEAPPVADEARRCWRKTRSIAPAPRAIGDYVLRGLDGLRSKMHESVLFERSEFTCECAEQLTESRKLCTAAWRCRGYRGA